MIKKGSDGRMWIVFPKHTFCTQCVLFPAGEHCTTNAHPHLSTLICYDVENDTYGRVVPDSPEARAELFVLKASKS